VYRCSEQLGGTSPWALRHNGTVPGDRTPPRPVAQSASPEEAVAIVAAIERFMRATAPAAAPSAHDSDPWLRAAILEGVERIGEADTLDPWINT